jgi:hypothetical protein
MLVVSLLLVEDIVSTEKQNSRERGGRLAGSSPEKFDLLFSYVPEELQPQQQHQCKSKDNINRSSI